MRFTEHTRWLLVGALLAASGCADKTPTQLVFRLQAESQIVSLAEKLRVRVYAVDIGGNKVLPAAFDEELDIGRTGIARDIPVIPHKLADTPTVIIEGELLDNNPLDRKVVSSLRAQTAYAPGELQFVDLVFEDACFDITCQEGQTCHRGECVGACVAPTDEAIDTPTCGPCQICGADGKCVTAADDTPCGCEGDVCRAGVCEIAVPAKEIATATDVSCAIGTRDDVDEVYCWGDPLLVPGEGPSRTPTFLEPFGGTPDQPTSLSGTFNHMCMVQGETGEVRCWGDNETAKFHPTAINDAGRYPMRGSLQGRTAVAVGAAGSHTCALTDDGLVHCWGDSEFGQAGEGDGLAYQGLPEIIPSTQSFAYMAAGFQHSCAIDTDGQTYCWGSNQFGQLGIVADEERHPSPLALDHAGQALDVIITNGGTCVLDADRSLSCTLRDEVLDAITQQNWVSVVGGAFGTCGLVDGRMLCIGSGSQVIPIGAIDDWTAVATSFWHNCGIREGGSVWCWGTDSIAEAFGPFPLPGRLGAGDLPFTRITSPRRICLP